MASEPSLKRSNASDSSLEDDKLVKAAKKGDEHAFAQIVEKYSRPLHFHILKMIKDTEQVEDLVQESFAKAFDSLKSYHTTYAFSTWLYRIATNHTIDYLRKKKLKTVSINEPVNTKTGAMKLQISDDKARADRQIVRKQRASIVREAINDLPGKYKDVIYLRHMEERSYKEISDSLDLPLGTVKAHIYRAREMLYKALKDRREEF